MHEIEWVITLEGTSLAFPGVGNIKKGERATLSDEVAKRAIEHGLAKPATVVEKAKPSKGKE